MVPQGQLPALAYAALLRSTARSTTERASSSSAVGRRHQTIADGGHAEGQHRAAAAHLVPGYLPGQPGQDGPLRNPPANVHLFRIANLCQLVRCLPRSAKLPLPIAMGRLKLAVGDGNFTR